MYIPLYINIWKHSLSVYHLYLYLVNRSILHRAVTLVLGSAVPISPAQKVWGKFSSPWAAAALPVQGTVTEYPKHLSLRLCLSICICFSVPRCHSINNEISIPPLPPLWAFPGICLCLDLINMDGECCSLSCGRCTGVHTPRACCLATVNFPSCFTDSQCLSLVQKWLWRVAEDTAEPDPCCRATWDGWVFGEETQGWRGILCFSAAGFD